ncbi:MAG: DUF4157 domain-containing protein [Chlorobiaceae bacterium]|nr:DUF4157 domain-containing protein [Chlorobiaceae bacterium]
MKSSADKSSSKSSNTVTRASSTPFIAPAGRGGFIAPAVQMKMEVSKPGDRLEQEADRMAGKVMRMTAPPTASPAGTERLQRQASDEKIRKAPPREEKLQRKSEGGATTASSGVQSAIQGSTGGQPLSSDVRGFMEPRFNADFGNVRIHDDQQSASLSNQLSARAFTYQNHIFFSRGQFQPGSSDGKQLLAHELTHTIQQGHAVQRSPEVSATAAQPQVQRSAAGEILDWIADKARNIPGFTMFTVILGMNPINMSTVDRSASNILQALVEFMPGGRIVTQALENNGIIGKVATWVEGQIRSLGMVGSMFKNALTRFIDSLGLSDLAPWNWGSVWNRAQSIFTTPINRLISFAGGLIRDILRFIREAILKPLAGLAQGTRGYDLLKALLGEDPITGEVVPRTAEALIGGFMKLIGQEEIWENIKKGNAIAKAWAWFQGALSGLLGFARSIPAKIIQTLASLTITDFLTVAGAFTKIVGTFAGIAGEFLRWALDQVISLLEIIFSVVAPGVMPYIKKAQATFVTILKNPIGFVGNLVRAGKLGFQRFAGRIVEHLKTALIKWLVGPLADAGVYIPKAFSLIEIIKLVLSVLGLTWQNIRGKLVKIIPEPILVGLEKTAGILVTLVKDGPAAAWEQIKTELGELKEQLISQITQMVSVEVVKAAVMKLVSMLNPAGAVIQAIIAIYNTVTFFIEKINQIAAVVASFIDSISAIASGQVDAAAAKVEQTLANTLTVVISFLAKFAGLGGIPNKIVGIIKKIRQPIDRGLDKIVAWLGNMLKSLKEKAKSLFFKPKTFAVKNRTHRIYAEGNNVMLASVPARLDGALTRFRSTTPPPSANIKALINQAEQKGTLLQSNIDKNDPNLEPTNEKLRDEIVALLGQIMYETDGESKASTMTRAEISFTVYGNASEFKRQIGMQQSALNAMKVGDWQKNRAKFVAFGRESRTIDSDKSRIEAFAKLIVANVNIVQGLSASDKTTLLKYADPQGKIVQETGHKLALSIAERLIVSRSARGEAVLHTVDQVAGGSATVYGDQTGVLGDSKINSSIGSQWKEKIPEVDAKAANVEASADINVKLNT